MSETAAWERVAAVAAAAPLWPLDAFELTESGRVDALISLQQLRGWAEAQELRLIAGMVRDTNPAEAEFVADEIACALRLAPSVVAAKLQLAEALAGVLSATLTALEAGTITSRHAQILADGVHVLTDDLARRVESQVLPGAARQSPAAFRAAVQRAVLAVDPREAEERHRAAREDRRVCVTPVADGMAELWALLPADGAATVLAALNARVASKTADDERTADQRRADALVDLAAAGLRDASLPLTQGRRPSVQVTVAANTLLGLDDAPGELDGYGPIPASMARALAFDATGTWRRLLTDSAGRLIDYGRTTYRPPQPLIDFVVARDRSCRFPGCRRPARRCDIDHLQPYGAGGVTAPCNCEALCEHHHRLKHEASWTLTGSPDDDLIWTSPTGHTYRSPPADYG